jgi:hypothetical protein
MAVFFHGEIDTSRTRFPLRNDAIVRPNEMPHDIPLEHQLQALLFVLENPDQQFRILGALDQTSKAR